MDDRRASLHGQQNTKYSLCAVGLVVAILVLCEFCRGAVSAGEGDAEGGDGSEGTEKDE
jgi:hypothetical protein